MPSPIIEIQGLSHDEVFTARQKYGSNKIEVKKQNQFLQACLTIVKEPMVVLLLAASLIYFISGQISDGFF
ncbi:hypothetical protein BH09BAC2_BH09BAC2_05230 [soil metagenome]